MLARPYIPEPKRWGRQNLWDTWEIDCWFADLFGRPRPPKPERIELATAEDVAARLKITPKALKDRLRQARQAAAADQDQAA
jgi:hypothetical protein